MDFLFARDRVDFQANHNQCVADSPLPCVLLDVDSTPLPIVRSLANHNTNDSPQPQAPPRADPGVLVASHYGTLEIHAEPFRYAVVWIFFPNLAFG